MSIELLNLEQQLDMCLTRPHITAETSSAMQIAADRWSAAVWTVAEASGPIELGKAEISRGLDVARRPIFVCGVHRSGTTLVHDLLDGHPSLAVLPSEGTFYTNFEPQLRRLRPERWLSFLGREWIRRLANPIHQEPYWLLGRSSQESSPYVTFARTLMAWWPLVQKRIRPVASSWPLVAIALAYAHCTGAFTASSTVERWAEKTPKNEQFLDRLRSDFPDAKLIHVVRHPFSVYASLKQSALKGGRFRNSNEILRDLNFSLRMAVEHTRGGPSSQYMLVRYEDLLEGTRSTVDRIAAFLRIEALPVLMQPSAAGLPAANNSSFGIDAAVGSVYPLVHRMWTDTLTPSDRERLTAVVGDAAASLGYDLTPVNPWRARLLRLHSRITSKFPG